MRGMIIKGVCLAIVAMPSAHAQLNCQSFPQSMERAHCWVSRGEASQAFGDLKSLAERGNASAQAELASFYRLGFGVKADQRASLLWAKRSFFNGNRTQAHAVATTYLIGLGQTGEAIRWLHIAVSEGDMGAAGLLADIFYEGKLASVDMCLAAYWYGRADAVLSDSQRAHRSVAAKQCMVN